MSDDVKAKAAEQHDLLRKTGNPFSHFLNGLVDLCMNEELGEESSVALWEAASEATVALSHLRHLLWMVKTDGEVSQ
jgi:hypothetical protein